MTRFNIRLFARDRRANVALLFGFLCLPIILGIGMSVDYGTAARLKSKLNAAADSAVLAAVTPAMMTQSDAVATQAAKNMFIAQTTGLPRLIFDGTQDAELHVAVAPNGGLARTVVVTYHAQSQNLFGGIVKWNTIPFGGTATGNAATPPNIDFYLMIDTSPSMAIAGTPTDIANMIAATPHQGDPSCRNNPGGPLCGCAFACHQASTNGTDNVGNPTVKKTGLLIDNYALARQNGITLRADLLDSAITTLTNTAASFATNPSQPVKPKYQMAMLSFDAAVNSLVGLTSNFVSSWSTQLATMVATNTQTLEVYSNNVPCATSTKVPNPCTAGVSNSDADTNYDNMMKSISPGGAFAIPDPGAGTNTAGDKPQEILFILTDGEEDEAVASGGNCGSATRQCSTMVGTKDWCTPLKNRGIKIAILYTEYFPLGADSWYNSYVASYQPSIGATLQNCASSGLFYEVGMGQDIAAALSQLFQKTVNSAHLTN
jgi:Flp pilus assembly protein TadG